MQLRKTSPGSHTCSHALYQLAALDGVVPFVARVTLLFGFVGVALRGMQTLSIDDYHDKMRNLPKDIEAAINKTPR